MSDTLLNHPVIVFNQLVETWSEMASTRVAGALLALDGETATFTVTSVGNGVAQHQASIETYGSDEHGRLIRLVVTCKLFIDGEFNPHFGHIELVNPTRELFLTAASVWIAETIRINDSMD